MTLPRLSILLLPLAALLGCSKESPKKTIPTASVVAQAPGPAVENTPVPVKQVEQEPEAPRAALDGVLYFAFDSTNLDDEARGRLQNNAKWMSEDSSRRLTIEGHTDEAGTSDYNLALGERRAQITRDYLVRLGVDSSKIKVITYGEERPAGSDDALNRRSVFVKVR